MNNFKLISAIAILFLLSNSCSKDDDGDKDITSKDLLIGEWQADKDPGYGDPTFYEDGRVEFHYYKEAWGDDFSEWGDWILNGSNLKITWDESDPGLEIYDTNILELTKTKLLWEVDIDGEAATESFTRK